MSDVVAGIQEGIVNNEYIAKKACLWYEPPVGESEKKSFSELQCMDTYMSFVFDVITGGSLIKLKLYNTDGSINLDILKGIKISPEDFCSKLLFRSMRDYSYIYSDCSRILMHSERYAFDEDVSLYEIFDCIKHLFNRYSNQFEQFMKDMIDAIVEESWYKERKTS